MKQTSDQRQETREKDKGEKYGVGEADGRDQQVPHPTVEQVNRRIGEQVKKENPKGDSGRLVATSRLCLGLEWVFGRILRSFLLTNWLRNGFEQAYFGFHWLWIGFFSVFIVHFWSLPGALSGSCGHLLRCRLRPILDVRQYACGLAGTFRLASEPQSRAQIEYYFLLSFLSYFILFLQTPFGGRKTTLYNYQRLTCLCRKSAIFGGRENCKSLYGKGLKIYGIFQDSKIVQSEFVLFGFRASE